MIILDRLNESVFARPVQILASFSATDKNNYPCKLVVNDMAKVLDAVIKE
jgi:hypothetical protein